MILKVYVSFAFAVTFFGEGGWRRWFHWGNVLCHYMGQSFKLPFLKVVFGKVLLLLVGDIFCKFLVLRSNCHSMIEPGLYGCGSVVFA
ncbi:hypothetical protein BUE76_23410 [Cnuella takakiae]|nr:hypothetical protein BUE76_23410 [Cnuella takakiae]